MHKNNFGVLRLAFAFLVIVSHSFEMIDGNRSREPLTEIFGTLSFGEVGVFGFFLVSGYLITQSHQNSRSAASYLWKRVLRIYPGFAVAFLLSVLVVAPFAGVPLVQIAWPKVLAMMAVLSRPIVPGAFADLPYKELNGSLWTIAYEFRCYLLILALGAAGLFPRRTWILLTFTGAMVIAGIFPWTKAPYNLTLQAAVGSLVDTIRFTAAFLVGACFYVFRDAIQLGRRAALVAAGTLCAALFSPIAAYPAFVVLGGYLIFWLAFLPNTPRLNRVNTKIDLSYGGYLYAWPVQSLLIKYVPGITPFSVIVWTTALSGLLAMASWFLIEKPCLLLKR